jgi:RHS repeat-associated protein
MLSNQWGGVAEKYRYSGFGETAILDPGGSARAESVAGSSLAFQGQFYQPKTGESFMRARWYKPDWGRFLSPDPGLFSGGQNLYAFVGNSPLLFTDPFGLGPTPPRGHIIPGYPGFLTNLYELTGQSSLMRVFDPTGTLGFSSRISVSFLIASTGYGVPGEIIEEAETNLANLNPLYRVSVAMEEAAGAQLEIVEKGWTVGRALNAQVQGLRTGVELLAAGAVVYSGRPGLGMVGEAGVAEAGSALGAGEAAAAAGRPAFLGGKYVHMTNPESFAGIQGERALISRGGIYAGPRTNAQTSGLELSLRTGLSPSSDVPVLIPKAAEGAFFQPLPIGPVTTWQRAMGHVYTPAGILDLNTGVFTRTGLPLTQIKWYLTDILFDLTMLRIILQPVPSGSTAAPPPDNPGR